MNEEEVKPEEKPAEESKETEPPKQVKFFPIENISFLSLVSGKFQFIRLKAINLLFYKRFNNLCRLILLNVISARRRSVFLDMNANAEPHIASYIDYRKIMIVTLISVPRKEKE